MFPVRGRKKKNRRHRVGEKMVEAGHQEVHRVGKMEIVSKICVYSLSEVAYEGNIGLRVNHSVCDFLPCSNYDRRFYKQRLWTPKTDSLPDPEDHPYGPHHPWALHC